MRYIRLYEEFDKSPTIRDRENHTYEVDVNKDNDGINFVVKDKDQEEAGHLVLYKKPEQGYFSIRDAFTNMKYRGKGLWKSLMYFAKEYMKGQGYKGLISHGQFRRPASDNSWKGIPDKQVVLNPVSRRKDYIYENIKHFEIFNESEGFGARDISFMFDTGKMKRHGNEIELITQHGTPIKNRRSGSLVVLYFNLVQSKELLDALLKHNIWIIGSKTKGTFYILETISGHSSGQPVVLCDFFMKDNFKIKPDGRLLLFPDTENLYRDLEDAEAALGRHRKIPRPTRDYDNFISTLRELLK